MASYRSLVVHILEKFNTAIQLPENREITTGKNWDGRRVLLRWSFVEQSWTPLLAIQRSAFELLLGASAGSCPRYYYAWANQLPGYLLLDSMPRVQTFFCISQVLTFAGIGDCTEAVPSTARSLPECLPLWFLRFYPALPSFQTCCHLEGLDVWWLDLKQTVFSTISVLEK